MISHLVKLSVLINLLESISQYGVSHSDIVSINVCKHILDATTAIPVVVAPVVKG